MKIKIKEFITQKEILKLISGSMELQELLNGTPGTFLNDKLKQYIESEPLREGESYSAIIIYVDNNETVLAHNAYDESNKPLRCIAETPLKQFGDFVDMIIKRKANPVSVPAAATPAEKEPQPDPVSLMIEASSMESIPAATEENTRP